MPVLLLASFWIFNLRFNLSGSMPIGLYQSHSFSKLSRGDWVTFCLPKELVKATKNEIQLPRGICPSGTQALVKEIIAIPNDHITVNKWVIVVNQKAYLAPQMLMDDYQQCTDKVINGYWVYGVNNPIFSWDSRYFGAVEKSAIQSIVRPILVWSNRELLEDFIQEAMTSSDSSSHSAGKK